MTIKLLGSTKVLVLSRPRVVAGGSLVTVAWLEDSSNPRHILPDGSVHPVYRKGYAWEVPARNLQDAE